MKAFVGHSFTESDAAVVRSFLDYLEQLSKVIPSFSWVHAREASPLDVSQKVLALSATCDLLIAICTKKEMVIDAKLLKNSRLSRSDKIVSSADIEWKTSDWIIQEIGMFFGRDLPIVLLLEAGCRRPGDFQGNVEFIDFDRSAPERAFGRMLEMISALEKPADLPNPGTGDTAASAATETPEAEETAPAKEEAPAPDWDIDKYRTSVFWPIYKKDQKTFLAIDTAFRASPFAKDAESVAVWEANAEHWRILLDVGGSLAKLERLANQFPDNSEIAEQYADGLKKFERFDRAADAYIRLSRLTEDPEKAITLICAAASSYRGAKKFSMAVGILMSEACKNELSTSQTFHVLDELRRVAVDQDDKQLSVDLLEALASIRPDDTSIRFSLAFKHSELSSNDLAMAHYVAIPVAGRTSSAWNNLGVAYAALGMPGKAVRSYQYAAEKDDTLAMSNLGYKYLNAGFQDDAQKQFEHALKLPDFHRNVSEGITALKDAPEKEDKQKREIIDASRAKSEFFASLGIATIQKAAARLDGQWQSTKCELAFSTEGDRFVAAGEYDHSVNALGLFADGRTKEKRKVKYEGTIVGRRVSGSISLSGGASTLLALGNDTSFVGLLNEAGDALRLMLSPNSRNPSFEDLTRQ